MTGKSKSAISTGAWIGTDQEPKSRSANDAGEPPLKSDGAEPNRCAPPSKSALYHRKIILQAVKDMIGPNSRHRTEAIAWVGSADYIQIVKAAHLSEPDLKIAIHYILQQAKPRRKYWVEKLTAALLGV